jgi:hypothetical protein
MMRREEKARWEVHVLKEDPLYGGERLTHYGPSPYTNKDHKLHTQYIYTSLNKGVPSGAMGELVSTAGVHQENQAAEC